MFAYQCFYVPGKPDEFDAILSSTWGSVTKKTEQLQNEGWEIMGFQNKLRHNDLHGVTELVGCYIFTRRPV